MRKESREFYAAVARAELGKGYSKCENHVSGRLKGMKNVPNWQRDPVISENVKVLERISKYAGHVLGGPTWNSIFGERLIYAPGIADMIEEYYAKDYKDDLQKLSPQARHDAPIYIVTDRLSVADAPIIPVVCKYEDDPSKDCIALLFNRNRILKLLGK